MSGPDQHFLHAGADEAGVDDLDAVERALGVLLHDGRGDGLRVGVGGPLGEPSERRLSVVPAEAEVGLRLAADEHEPVTLALLHGALHFTLGGAQHRRVVATAQAAVGDQHEVALLADLRPGLEERALDLGAGRRRDVLHDLGDLVAVGNSGPHPFLGASDAAGGDELHGARDLLGRLHRLDAAPEDALLTTSHAVTPSPASCRTRPRRGPRHRSRADRR